MSCNGSVRILTAQTNPVCRSLMKNNWMDRRITPATPIKSQHIPILWTNSHALSHGLIIPKNVGLKYRGSGDNAQIESNTVLRRRLANLDLFFVFVGGVVYRIVTLRFKEEMADLPAGHRHHPSDQSSDRRIPEQQKIHENKAARAQKMERLID